MDSYKEIFKYFTDMELVQFHYRAKIFPEDEDFCKEIMMELGKRAKEKLKDSTDDSI